MAILGERAAKKLKLSALFLFLPEQRCSSWGFYLPCEAANSVATIPAYRV
jgi:hypothetical protein